MSSKVAAQSTSWKEPETLHNGRGHQTIEPKRLTHRRQGNTAVEAMYKVELVRLSLTFFVQFAPSVSSETLHTGTTQHKKLIGHLKSAKETSPLEPFRYALECL